MGFANGVRCAIKRDALSSVVSGTRQHCNRTLTDRVSLAVTSFPRRRESTAKTPHVQVVASGGTLKSNVPVRAIQ